LEFAKLHGTHYYRQFYWESSTGQYNFYKYEAFNTIYYLYIINIKNN